MALFALAPKVPRRYRSRVTPETTLACACLPFSLSAEVSISGALLSLVRLVVPSQSRAHLREAGILAVSVVPRPS